MINLSAKTVFLLASAILVVDIPKLQAIIFAATMAVQFYTTVRWVSLSRSLATCCTEHYSRPTERAPVCPISSWSLTCMCPWFPYLLTGLPPRPSTAPQVPFMVSWVNHLRAGFNLCNTWVSVMMVVLRWVRHRQQQRTRSNRCSPHSCAWHYTIQI